LITINPRVLRQLQGCQGFSFHTGTNWNKKERLNFRSKQNREEQTEGITGVLASIKKFGQLPCEMNLVLGVIEGRMVMEGTIDTLDQNSMNKSQTLLQEIEMKMTGFRHNYPRTAFTFTVEQTVEVTDVHI